MDTHKIEHWIAELAAEEESLTARLARVRAARLALAHLQVEQAPAFDGKLADAIRTVLKSHRGSLSPTEVREHVKALGYDIGKHDNQMAAIHGVLRALVDSEEVKSKVWKKQPDVKRYHWADESVWTSQPVMKGGTLGDLIRGTLLAPPNPAFEDFIRVQQKAIADSGLTEHFKEALKDFPKLDLPDNPLTKK